MVQMDEDSGYDEITKRFKANPTLENYVRLRRDYPDAEVQIAVSGGLEALFALQEDLRRWDLEPELVVGAMNANLDDQAEMSLRLMELLLKRQELKACGGTSLVSRDKAIGDSLVNYLITVALDGCDWTDRLTITRDLLVLIKYQLGTWKSDYDDKWRTHEKRTAAIHIAAQMIGDGNQHSYEKIAELLDVNKSTVMRWFPEETLFQLATDLLRRRPDYMETSRK